MLSKWTIAYTDDEMDKPASERLALAELCEAVGLVVREYASVGVTVEGSPDRLNMIRGELEGHADIEPFRPINILAG